jgi:putative ABC transport system ATP-binding protein
MVLRTGTRVAFGPHRMSAAPATECPLVELRRVRKDYAIGDVLVHALRDVDFVVRRGELVAIMGASGSGKSTMLNILGTLDRPSSGEHLIDGEPIHTLPDGELAAIRNRSIGFVFQSFNLLPRETALANVELPMVYGGEPRAVRRARAARALERVGLAERMDHLPTQLSGGQQQRVAIARAIVNGPALLLADEPTGALDSTTTKQIMALLVELHRQGITVVIVTHDAGIADYAHRVVSFQDGVIIRDENRTHRYATAIANETTNAGRAHGSREHGA